MQPNTVITISNLYLNLIENHIGINFELGELQHQLNINR